MTSFHALSSPALLPLALLSLVLLLLLRAFTNWRSLRKAPGPFLAGATDLWRAYHQYHGQLRQELVALHRRHGPVVRYGVNSVSISDPEVISVVYGSRAGFVTAESYNVLIGIQNGKPVPSLVSTRDEARHAALRRAVAPAFTPAAALAYEDSITETIADLLGVLARKSSSRPPRQQQQQHQPPSSLPGSGSGLRRTSETEETETETETSTSPPPPPPPFDLAATMLHASIDAAGRFAFGEAMGCLAAGADVGGSVQLIRDRFVHWGRWSSLPWLEGLVYRNRVALWWSSSSSSLFSSSGLVKKRAPSSMVAAAVAKLQDRKKTLGVGGGGGGEGSEDGEEKEKEKQQQRKDLLGHFLEASKDHPQALDTPGIVGMLMSTISGAGDTTSTTVTAVLYLLLRHPRAMRRLEEELLSANLVSSSPSSSADVPPAPTPTIPSFSQVKSLPYLHAVIRESMRLFSTATFPIERTVPPGGATIAGMFFPAGTTVGCLPAAMHLNEGVYGEDVDVFRPERWLLGGEEGPLEKLHEEGGDRGEGGGGGGGSSGRKEALRRMEASHMGFSRGRRVCLGQHIAVLQMKKVIPAVLLRFKLSLVDPAAELEADFSAAVACLKPLYVRAELREEWAA